MLASIPARAATVGDAVLAASRQVWLAGLGAAVVTREWAGKEAGGVFRNLVREGTAVESRAFRFVGDRLDTSFVQASSLFGRARATVASVAGTAATLVRDALPSRATPRARPARTAKPSAKRSRKAAAPKRKRTSKAAAKRA